MKSFFKQHPWWRRLAEFALLLLVLFSVRLWQQQGVYQGTVLPLQGQLLSGEKIDTEQLKGRPFLLHFWADWCPVCRLEEDSINSVAKDYTVITVASWSENAAAYMKQKGLSFPVLDDPEGGVATQYGIKAVPASFFVDAEGNIRFTEVGYTTEVGFRARLWWLN